MDRNLLSAKVANEIKQIIKRDITPDEYSYIINKVKQIDQSLINS